MMMNTQNFRDEQEKMMILQETYHLENGVQIPKLGLGT